MSITRHFSDGRFTWLLVSSRLDSYKIIFLFYILNIYSSFSPFWWVGNVVGCPNQVRRQTANLFKGLIACVGSNPTPAATRHLIKVELLSISVSIDAKRHLLHKLNICYIKWFILPSFPLQKITPLNLEGFYYVQIHWTIDSDLSFLQKNDNM